MWWWNKQICWAALLSLLPLLPLWAQPKTDWMHRVATLLPVPGIADNFVSNLAARGDSLWIGPRLDLTFDGGQTWYRANVDSITQGRGRVYALLVIGDTVWASLGTRYLADLNGDGIDDDVFEAVGLVVSTDGGQSWSFRFPPLDAPADTVILYGSSRLPAVPIVSPQLTTTFDLAYDRLRHRLWVASWYGGLRYSDDWGRSWHRAVLPPDTLDALRPERSYFFRVGPPTSAQDRYDNYFAFAVHVDGAGAVWAGTAGGINRSEDGGLSWDRFANEGHPNAPTGNWIVAIAEQVRPNGQHVLWFATRPAGRTPGETFGITRTADGGRTFEQVLLGERINDFAFRGDTVYAAGDNGLFVSTDQGRTWQTIRDFYDPTSRRVLRPDVRVLAVATTRRHLWIGTSDGLLRSDDGGRTWRLFRAEVPVKPTTPSPQVPRVDTYAYPNPFSPMLDAFVRIRYDLAQPASVRVHVFDFGLQRVRTLFEGMQEAGAHEVIWDGLDARGVRVANGVYFYAVETDAATYWGKILVIE